MNSAKNPQSRHRRSAKTALLGTESAACPQCGGGCRPHHFCLDGFRFLPFHLFFFRDCRKARPRMKILCLFWKLQISYLPFQGWSWVRSFFGGHVPSPLLLRDIRGGGPQPLSHGAQARADGRLWVAPRHWSSAPCPLPWQPWGPAATQPRSSAP